MSKLPLQPKKPERVCWGCEKYCSADRLDCGNGTVRTQHPIEIFGADWADWSLSSQKKEAEDVTLGLSPGSPSALN